MPDGLRLLLVEDHDDVAELLASLLAMRGHAVKIARSARDALRAISAETFDVMVSDVGLPDASGYELMRQVRARGATKGIAMSGWGRPEDIARSREAGFAEHLIKPVLLKKLEQAIARVHAMDGAPT